MGKGDFLLRLDPELLAEVRKAAEGEGVSVSGFIREAVALRLSQGSFPRPASRADLLAEIADVASKVRAGFVLVPAAEVPAPGSWSGLMDGEVP